MTPLELQTHGYHVVHRLIGRADRGSNDEEKDDEDENGQLSSPHCLTDTRRSVGSVGHACILPARAVL